MLRYCTGLTDPCAKYGCHSTLNREVINLTLIFLSSNWLSWVLRSKANKGRSIIIKGNKTNGVNRLNSVQEATSLKKKSTVGTNEMYSNC